MNKPKQKNYVKATDRESGEPRYSSSWLLSKRTHFSVYGNRIKIGSWNIPFEDIKDIVLYKTKQMSIPVSVLVIQTAEKNYQIGFNPWVNPIKNIPKEVRIENIKLKHSLFSIVIRIVLVSYLAYWIWTEFLR